MKAVVISSTRMHCVVDSRVFNTPLACNRRLITVAGNKVSRYACALAHHECVDMDLVDEPLGEDQTGKPVFLRDIWPSDEEVQSVVKRSVAATACDIRPNMIVSAANMVFVDLSISAHSPVAAKV